MSLLPASSIGDESTGFYNGVATQSLRFDDGSSDHLTFTPSSASSATDRRKITHAVWIKRANIGTYQAIYSTTQNGGPDYYQWRFANDDTMTLYLNVSNYDYAYDTAAVYRDTMNWYHFVLIIDTTQSTDTNRVKLYANGVQQTLNVKFTNHVGQNFSNYVMDGNEDAIGEFNYNSSARFDGYMCDFITTIGQDNSISDFGETKNGVWIAKNYSGSYGANGFRLQFDQTGTGTASTSTIGADTSGNTNHWTSNNLASGDSTFPDSPENNFATLNLLDKSGGTFTEGNLRYDTSSWDMATGTVLLPSGKWYYEVRVDAYNASANAFSVGIIQTNKIRGSGNSYYWSHSSWSTSSQGYLYGVNVNGTTEYKISAGSATSLSSHPDIVQGSVIGIFIDLESDTTSIKYNIDGGTPFELFTSMQDVDYTIGVSDYLAQLTFNFGQDSTFSGQETAGGNTDGNGEGDFHTALPSGHTDYLAICSANLPNPTIGPQTSTQADDHFNTVLYSGNSSNTHQITGVGFQPDWLWIKVRNSTGSHYLVDSSRGLGTGDSMRVLMTNGTTVEYTAENDQVRSFDADGFTLDDNTDITWFVNRSGETYVAWNWKANGGTTTTNDASSTGIGTIDSVFQANTTAGFSIVTYTGTGSAGTIAHGLGEVPKMIIIKNRDSSLNWIVYHAQNTSAPETEYLHINTTNMTQDSAIFFNDTAPTSSVISLGTGNNVNDSGDTYVAYVFADIEGYSKFGGYIGNGSTNGTFVYTDFRPAWLMLKRTGPSGTSGWSIFDIKRNTFNPVNTILQANSNGSDGTSYPVDFLSNGFKLRTSDSTHNQNGSTYIFMAFAEQPFKFSNSR